MRGPLADLLAELEPEFGPGDVFRPYRDVRFSKDKTPYKDHQGAFVETEDAIGYYVQVSAEGLRVAGGWYDPRASRSRATATSWPARRASSSSGDRRRRQQGRLRARRRRLKTRPRGRRPRTTRGSSCCGTGRVVVGRHWQPPAWMSRPAGADQGAGRLARDAPLVEWLADHVGPGRPTASRRSRGERARPGTPADGEPTGSGCAARSSATRPRVGVAVGTYGVSYGALGVTGGLSGAADLQPCRCWRSPAGRSSRWSACSAPAARPRPGWRRR